MGKTYRGNERRSRKSGSKPFKKQGKQNNQQPKKWKFSEREAAEIYDDMRL